MEVDAIARLVRDHRLITLTGAGGVGKTQMALHVGATVGSGTDVAAYFVGFAPLNDAALVATAVAAALHVQEVLNRPLIETLLADLRDRRLLLILDNCEHVIAEAATVAETLLRGCPHLRILATSRELLGVAGERAYRLPSLSIPSPEAVRRLRAADATAYGAMVLFTERASAVDHRFTLADENAPLVAELCRRLDGIPLAIELAAARVNVLSVKALTERLADRFRILTSGERTALPRHQTMRAAIDWSYDLLSAREQRLFERLSAFAGGSTLEAATTVCAGQDVAEDDVLDVLSSLVAKSLVTASLDETEPRYRLLESFRQYARERLATHPASSLLRRHAQFFSDVAARAYTEWDTAPGPDWLARHEKELDNFRAALHWAFDDENDVATGTRIAADVAPLFLRLSLLREGIGWCERAIAFAPGLAPAVGARLYYGLSMLLHNQGANERALASAQRAVDLYREANAERGLARALSQVAHHLVDRDDYDDARAAAEEALRRARGLDDPRLLASTLQRCAFIYNPEDIELARAWFSESVALFRSLGRPDEIARALAWWSDAEAIAGNVRAAVDIACDALEMASDDAKVYLWNGLAGCYIVLGERAHALQASREALGLAVKAGHPVAMPCAMLYLAALEAEANAVHAARLSGYALARLQALNWTLVEPDRAIEERLQATLQGSLAPEELDSLREAGAAWSEEEAIVNAERV